MKKKSGKNYQNATTIFQTLKQKFLILKESNLIRKGFHLVIIEKMVILAYK